MGMLMDFLDFPYKWILLLKLMEWMFQYWLLTSNRCTVGTSYSARPSIEQSILFTKTGWPDHVSENLKTYWNRRHELTTEGNCIMWGLRVIVPKSLQTLVMQELHQEHQGIAKVKTIVRSYVWPNLDRYLEQTAKNCLPRQQVKNIPAVAPLHPWVRPSKPW